MHFEILALRLVAESNDNIFIIWEGKPQTCDLVIPALINRSTAHFHKKQLFNLFYFFVGSTPVM